MLCLYMLIYRRHAPISFLFIANLPFFQIWKLLIILWCLCSDVNFTVYHKNCGEKITTMDVAEIVAATGERVCSFSHKLKKEIKSGHTPSNNSSSCLKKRVKPTALL